MNENKNEVQIIASGPVGSGKSALLGEIEIMCNALGIPVRYADEAAAQSEKNATHAEWTVELERCKPSVVLVEGQPWRDAQLARQGQGEAVAEVASISVDHGEISFDVKWKYPGQVEIGTKLYTAPQGQVLRAAVLDGLPLHYKEGVENGGYYLATDVIRALAVQAATLGDASAPQQAVPVQAAPSDDEEFIETLEGAAKEATDEWIAGFVRQHFGIYAAPTQDSAQAPQETIPQGERIVIHNFRGMLINCIAAATTEKRKEFCDALLKAIDYEIAAVRQAAQQQPAAPMTYDEFFAEAKRLGCKLPANLTAERAAVPEGWKLVPIEPTPWMTTCGLDHMEYGRGFEGNAKAADVYRAMLAAAPSPQEGDPLDMRLPCDIKIGAGIIGKGCKLRTLVLRAQGLHRMLMEHMPKPTPEQQAAFQALLTHGPDAQEGKAVRENCNWTLDDEENGIWQSACGETWSFVAGGPVENFVRFCQCCGKPVHLAQQGSAQGDAKGGT